MSRSRGSNVPCTLGALLLISCAGAPAASPRDVADANDVGRTLAPTSDGERYLLKRLPELPAGGSVRLDGGTATADATYDSASGRKCRSVHFSSGSRQSMHRLACTDGLAWFFVPEVFAAASW